MSRQRLDSGRLVYRTRLKLYLAVLAVAARLPLRLAYAVARRLGRARYRRLPRSLWFTSDVARVLGVTREQAEEWGRRASEMRVSDELDAHLFPRLTRERLERLIRIEGLEHLDSALAGGKGAILVAPHIEGRHLFFAELGNRGYEPTLVGYSPTGWWVYSVLPVELREQRNAVLGRFGCRFIFMETQNFGVAVKAANVLRRNGVVVMLVDLPHAKTAVEVDLLGGRTRFSAGPALVAQATGAPLLDFYIHRGDGWIPQVAEIGVPFSVSDGVDRAVQECAARLESSIRRHPPPPRKYLSGHPWNLAVRPLRKPR